MPDAAADSTLDVACDESGSEGEHLIGGNTDVFAHGSVRLGLDDAAACVAEVRSRIRSPATEYKANHLLRQKQRAVLMWFLGAGGPLVDRAHVVLTDKTFYVLSALIDLLDGDGDAAGAAARLRREGARAFGEVRWNRFLETGNLVLRSGVGLLTPTPVDAFFAAVDDLRRIDDPHELADVLDRLSEGRSRVVHFRRRVTEHPAVVPLLEPLIPALVSTVLHWCGVDCPVSIVHDETNTLTEDRLAHVRREVGPRLSGVRMVDSQQDPRVQLADFLAGVARKLASQALNGRADVELTALLSPYVDADSCWGDPPSWELLGPPVVHC
ncbi:MAG: DUF3800 domain-containing protein [Nocardioidaceae bacterium]